MADPGKKLSANVPGDFFVDSTCINCDTCRQVAPAIFEEVDGYAAVVYQPGSYSEKLAATRALLSCPTGSIGNTGDNHIAAAREQFPLLLDGNVYYNGFNSEKSFGGNSYFIKHEAGNWLVDAPRFTASLVEQFTAAGGIKYIFLTHRDDVADADRYSILFDSKRIIHRDDLDAQPDAEIVIDGFDAVEIEPEFLIIPTPGHTEGHMVLLYRSKYLFTGDHLAWNRQDKELRAFFRCCWYSWSKQKESLALLQNYSFEWILPGHGQRVHLSAEEMRAEMKKLVSRI